VWNGPAEQVSEPLPILDRDGTKGQQDDDRDQQDHRTAAGDSK
jgi:hypothetical protein